MKKLLTLAVVMLTSIVALPSASLADIDSRNIREGAMYERIVPPQPTSSGDKVEIVDIFYYGCPHCHRFIPYMEKWLEHKPDNVAYTRMPAVLRQDWSLLGRAYYAAEVLGVLDETHNALFDGIHNEKRKELFTEDGLLDFYANYGIDRETFRKTLYSFAVESKIRWAKQMIRRYRISGTPTVIVNGKYRVTPTRDCDFNCVINVVDYLVKQESGTNK